jgi:chromosome segregation ATPase
MDMDYVLTLKRNYAAVSNYCVAQTENARKLQTMLSSAYDKIAALEQREREWGVARAGAEQLASQISQLSKQLAEARTEAQAADSRTHAVRAQLATVLHAKADLTSRLAQTQASLQTKTDETRSLRGAIEALPERGQLAELRNAHAGVAALLGDAQTGLAAAQQELQGRADELKRFANLLRRTELERDDAASDLARARSKAQQLQRDVAAAQADAEEWRGAAEVHAGDVSTLQRQLAALKTALANQTQAQAQARTQGQDGAGDPEDSASGSGPSGSMSGEELSTTIAEAAAAPGLRAQVASLKAQLEALWEEKMAVEDQFKAINSGALHARYALYDVIVNVNVNVRV